MPDLEAARIIREARQNKECCYFDKDTLNIISTCPSLNDTEKLIWLFLTSQASTNITSHSFIITEQQIAKNTNNKLDKVIQAIANLKKEGFLEAQLSRNGALEYFPKCPITYVSVK